MNWENCRNYGLIIIQKSGALQLHYDRNYFLLAPNPNPYMKVDSALWQGNCVIVKGRNQYGEPLCYILHDVYNSEIIT